MKKLQKICLWVFGSLIALILLLFGVAMFLLTPERLTPIVKSVAQQYLNAEVDFETVNVSLFNDFPRVEISLQRAVVVSHALATPDTLVSFKNFAMSINALQLIGGKVAIRSVSVTEPWIAAVIDSTGVASWDIVKDSTPDSDTSSTKLDLQIQSIKFLGRSKIEFTDDRDSTYIEATWGDLQVLGQLTSEVQNFSLGSLQLTDFGGRFTTHRDSLSASINIDTLAVRRNIGSVFYAINLRVNGVNFKSNADTLAHNLRLAVNGNVALNKDSVRLDGLKFKINDILSQIDGNLIVGDSTLRSDIRLSSPAIKLVDVVALVPSLERDLGYKIESNISFDIDATVDGTYNFNRGSLPDISLNIASENGYLALNGVSERLDRFAITARASIKGGKASLTVDNIDMQGAGISLAARGTVGELFGDPIVDMNIDSKLNADMLLTVFPALRQQFTASGIVAMRSGGKFKLSQLNIRQLASTELNAEFSFERFKFELPSQMMQGLASGTIKVGTNTNKRDTTMAVGLAVVGLHIVMDTIGIKIGDMVNMSGKRISAWATSAASRYSGGRRRVHPFRGSLTAKRFQATTADSSLYRINKLVYDFTVSPSADSDTIPMLKSTLKAGSMAIKSGLDRVVMRKVEFLANANLVPANKNAAKRRKQRLDSLQAIYPAVHRDSLLSHVRRANPAAVDLLASGDIDMKLDGSLLQLLRRWQAQGSLSASQIRLVTPYIPLRTAIEDVDISFNNDRVELRSFCLEIGRSHLDMTGSVSNLKRVLAGRGTLKVQLKVDSDTIDCTQLIKAINAGVNSHDKIARAVDSIGGGSEEQIAQIIEQQTSTATQSSLIIIPKNVDLNAKLVVKRAIYGAVVMDSLVTELIARDRVLQIKQLSAASNIGQMSLEAMYATSSIHDISTGFDLELKQVKVAELIDLMPSIDTLLPMLASFEGIVDCKIAAKTAIDSAMNIIIPSLDAAASIGGHNLVLLDGETFTEISKLLKFKNRKRNFVDSISVQMLVKDSKIEIFPFILTLDRYQTAVSGVQNLDMSFDYHISVLKSVVPFRLGVNIYGNLDDWKFKLVKAKYKNDHIPSYVAHIDTVRLNLRHEIDNIFHRIK